METTKKLLEIKKALYNFIYFELKNNKKSFNKHQQNIIGEIYEIMATITYYDLYPFEKKDYKKRIEKFLKINI